MKNYILFLLFITASVSANAQYYQWVGGSSGSWGDPNSWENEFGDPEVPGFGADIYISLNSFVFYDGQFGDLYNSISVEDSATLVSTLPINVISNFYLAPNASVELYFDDLNNPYDGIIEVLNGTYEIYGQITPRLGGDNYMPQTGDQIVVATAPGSGSICNVSGDTELFIFYENGFSQFEVIYAVTCDTPNQMTLNIGDINYSGAKSWDNETGNSQWSTPENWDPNGIPTQDDYVIINKIGGGTVLTGDILQDRVSIGNNNHLTVNGDIEISHAIKLNGSSSLDWTSGALLKRIDGDFPAIWNWGTMTVNGVTLEDTGTIINQNDAVIEMNGNININNGRLINANGGTININGDNLTIGYTSGSDHRLSNFFGSTIEKTVGSGSGTSSIILTEFTNGNGAIIKSEQGTLVIGESFENQGILTGSGAFSFPSGFVNSGEISPGSSPGILTVVGDLTTAPEAVFNIEIDGPTMGSQYDNVIVQNNANIEGDINVVLGYMPPSDAVFEILSATSLNSNNLPETIEADFDGNFMVFSVEIKDNSIYLVGPGATLSNADLEINQLTMYPNPTSGIVNLDFKKQVSELSVSISNILGQVITNEQFININTVDVHINGNPGIYFLSLKTPEGFEKILKIIKN